MENNTHTRVKERQLAQSLGQLIKMEFNISKGTLRRCEIHLGTTRLSITNNRQRRHWNTMLIGLLMDFTVTTDSQAHLLGQRINNRNAYTMQAARDLVAIIIKLTASMKYSHNYFGR